jgi:hypothetical protein
MLARVSAGFCSVCGAVLRDGVCPNGHPQRAQRRLHNRRRRRGLWTLLVVFLLASAGAYAGLVWYPRRAAAELMEGPSRAFESSLGAYRTTVSAFPPGATDPQALSDGCAALLATSGPTRDRLGRDTIELELQSPPEVPVVSSRPPLQQARELRDLMLDFNTRAQEVLGRLEAACGYVTQATGVLPQLDTLGSTLGDPRDLGAIRASVAAATPIAEQLLADLRALAPPPDLGGLHSALQAIARRIRADLEEIDRTAQAGGTPVVRALLGDIRSSFDTFRQTLGTAPEEAGAAGLGTALEEVEGLAQQIVEGLRTLRQVHGLVGVSVPEG